jgi:hypothetical protein
MTAIALSALGRHAEAEATAERLRAMAKEPEQKDAALLTREDVRRAREHAEKPRDPASVRDAVLRLYTRLEGQLIRVDCLGERARFWVTAGGQTRKLLIADSTKVVTGPEAGAPVEFGCGVQNRSVVIGFQPDSNAETGTEGRIRYLEFRSPLN